MRTTLLVSTCVLALASQAQAETKITTATTAPVNTATAASGQPDAITVTSTGSIATTSPVAITIGSNNAVLNQGAMTIVGVNNATGIQANAGVTSGITNSGTIKIDETYTPTDNDNDGDLDGPFALGSGRAGIRTLGAFIGNISNSGTITVKGNSSAGIQLGGPLAGNFTHDGKTSVLGSDSIGVSLGAVTGDVKLAGTIDAQGQNAVAVRAGGDITGAVVVQGAITSTGYRYPTPPADRSKLDVDDLLQGGPAVSIEGNVTKGVILAAAAAGTTQGTAAVTSLGSAAALRIGSATQAVTLGSVPNTASGYGLIIDGSLTGNGLYAGSDGNALQVGGLGNSVTITNGIGVSGTVQAMSVDRAATAIHLAAGTTTPELRSSGKISASSGTSATASAIAVSLDAGANLPALRNSGEIRATLSGAGGVATAIVDHSGTLSLIENSGQIVASGAAAGSNIAVDLSSNNTGAIIRQTVVAANFAAPNLTGNIKFGSGGDLLDVADGKQTGDIDFGGGSNKYLLSGKAIAAGKLTFGSGNDSLQLSGTSSLSGTVDFGGGTDTLTLAGTSVFTGQLLNSAGASVAVSDATLNIQKAATIATLDVAGGGSIGVLLDNTAGNGSQLNVLGSANFADNSKLKLSVADIGHAEGTFTVLTAGTLVGADKLTANSDLLPFIYKGTLSTAGNQVKVSVGRKTAQELGLNASESSAYSAIYTALGTDKAVGDSFLGIRDGRQFVSTLQQMLPDHAGGVFEAATAGDRASARFLNEPPSFEKPEDQAKLGAWANQVVWGGGKDVGSTAGYKISGWGTTVGVELASKLGRFGLGLHYLFGKDNDRATDNLVDVNQLGLAAHWRFTSGGFQAGARGSWSHLGLDSSRHFSSDASGTAVQRTIESKWKGSIVSATASVSQQLWSGSWYVRPAGTLEYYRLSEGAHAEHGGGTALDLIVAKRTSSEVAINGLLAGGIEFGPSTDSSGYFALEAEVGRRQIVGGSLGATVAHFSGGADFTLTPEERQSGFVARMRAVGGGEGLRLAGELGGEQREGRTALSARVSLALGL